MTKPDRVHVISEPSPVHDFYKILVVGRSGSGKTYAARNLDANRTGFINVENKPMPFRKKWKHEVRITPDAVAGIPPHQRVLNAILEFHKNPEIDTIVLDSFSAYIDLLMIHCRTTQRGWDIMNEYNAGIGTFNDYVKRAKKTMFVTAHYEVLSIESVPEKRVKTQGKAWEGMVEKDYTIVLYADVQKEEGKRAEYRLLLSGQDNSAKCPPDIFGAEVEAIPNDLKTVVNALTTFTAAEAA